MDKTDTKQKETHLVVGVLGERAQEVVDRVKQHLAPVDSWIRTMARERPLLTLAGAAGLGYLVGRLIRRV